MYKYTPLILGFVFRTSRKTVTREKNACVGGFNMGANVKFVHDFYEVGELNLRINLQARRREHHFAFEKSWRLISFVFLLSLVLNSMLHKACR